MEGTSVAAEVVSASTAIAGLLLVYLGALATGYGQFQPQERRSVRPAYYLRAWVAFVSMVFALAAALFGILARWIPSERCGDAAVVLLIFSFISGVWIAYQTAAEIK